MQWNLASILFWTVLLLGPLLVVLVIYLVGLAVHLILQWRRRRLERAARRDGRLTRPVVTSSQQGAPFPHQAPRDD